MSNRLCLREPRSIVPCRATPFFQTTREASALQGPAPTMTTFRFFGLLCCRKSSYVRHALIASAGGVWMQRISILSQVESVDAVNILRQRRVGYRPPCLCRNKAELCGVLRGERTNVLLTMSTLPSRMACLASARVAMLRAEGTWGSAFSSPESRCFAGLRACLWRE